MRISPRQSGESMSTENKGFSTMSMNTFRKDAGSVRIGSVAPHNSVSFHNSKGRGTLRTDRDIGGASLSTFYRECCDP